MCYVNSSADMTLVNYVGREDRLSDMTLHLHADADLAGERPTFKSTAGYLASIHADNTEFAFAAKSKSIASVCNSTPEAELAAANRVVKEIGFAVLDLLDKVCERKVQCRLLEDNTAAIQIIKSGRNPTMRHLARHQGISIRFLHDTFFSPR